MGKGEKDEDLESHTPKVIDMSYECFDPKTDSARMDKIIDEALRRGLSSIDFEECRFVSRDFIKQATKDITRVILASTKCTYINLSCIPYGYNGLIPKPGEKISENFIRLTQAIKKNPVCNLILKGACWSLNELKELSEVLTGKESLNSLDLSDNDMLFSTYPAYITRNPIKNILTPIKNILTHKHCSLTSLILSGIDLQPKGLLELTECFQNSSLTYLDLSNNEKVGSKGFIHFADFIGSSKMLKSLKLNHAGMDFSGLEILLKSLNLYNNQTLNSLSLSNNGEMWKNSEDYLSEKDFQAPLSERTENVFKSLKWKSQSLEYLDISFTLHMFEEFSGHKIRIIKALGNCLVGESCPERLNFSTNKINDAILMYMMPIFQSPKLQELDLSGNHLCDISFIILDQLLSSNVKLFASFIGSTTYKFQNRTVESLKLNLITEPLNCSKEIANIILQFCFGEDHHNSLSETYDVFVIFSTLPKTVYSDKQQSIKKEIIETVVWGQSDLIIEYCGGETELTGDSI